VWHYLELLLFCWVEEGHLIIPISIHEDSVARLKHNSYMFPVIQQTRVIIWDKVPMQHKYDIDCHDLAKMAKSLFNISFLFFYY